MLWSVANTNQKETSGFALKLRHHRHVRTSSNLSKHQPMHQVLNLFLLFLVFAVLLRQQVVDDLLRITVTEQSEMDWKNIAAALNARFSSPHPRNDVQCLHRWQKVLHPGFKKRKARVQRRKLRKLRVLLLKSHIPTHCMCSAVILHS
jgi:Myb-like DNA-binding domain